MDNSQIDKNSSRRQASPSDNEIKEINENKESKDNKSNESNENNENSKESNEYIIDYEYLNQSLLTVENVENILYTISSELQKISYVTYDYPDNNEIINNKYSIINIKQFFLTSFKEIKDSKSIKNNNQNLENNSNIEDNIEEFEDKLLRANSNNSIINQDLNDDNISKTSFSEDSIGHFIIIINNYPTCIIYPLYYINCIKLTEYLKDKCKFENIVWNYDIIQHGNSSSCGWECCKIAYDYFMKNKIEIECKDYVIQNI